jgi:magnesium transporter
MASWQSLTQQLPLRPKKRRPARAIEAGAAPGTLVGAADAEPTRLFLMRYGPDLLDERPLDSLHELTPAEVAGAAVTWLDVRGLRDHDQIEAIAARFGIHPLAAADAVNTPQRAKTEAYPNHTLIVTHMARLSEGPLVPHRELVLEQLAIVLGPGWMVTFQERHSDGDVLEPVRRRIRSGRGRIRGAGADYLAYALIDAVVDGLFPLLDEVGQALEDLEIQSLERPHPKTAQQIHGLKRTLLGLRRTVWPQREALHGLLRGDGEEDAPDALPLLQPPTRVYLRDVHDHLVQVAELIESYREFAASLMDLYLSAVNNRMNEVVKVLTIISTIFLPLSFIAGIYGMNFDPSISRFNMPELRWVYGYPFALGLMTTVGLGMLWLFRRFGWIGRPSKWPREPHAAEAPTARQS